MSNYGKELILDLHDCDANTFDKAHIEPFLHGLCKKIDMHRADLHWWDDMDYPEEDRQTDSHTFGTSCCQFILTSSIVIHSLPKLKQIYINIFSCKDFDPKVVEVLARITFDGTVVQSLFITRK